MNKHVVWSNKVQDIEVEYVAKRRQVLNLRLSNTSCRSHLGCQQPSRALMLPRLDLGM